jgi:hypothetical protein
MERLTRGSRAAGQGATELALQNVTVSPSPVKAGKNFTLNLDLFNGKCMHAEDILRQTRLHSSSTKTKNVMVHKSCHSRSVTVFVKRLNNCPCLSSCVRALCNISPAFRLSECVLSIHFSSVVWLRSTHVE